MEELLRYRVLPVTGAPTPHQTDEVGRARAARRGRVKAPPAEAVA